MFGPDVDVAAAILTLVRGAVDAFPRLVMPFAAPGEVPADGTQAGGRLSPPTPSVGQFDPLLSPAPEAATLEFAVPA